MNKISFYSTGSGKQVIVEFIDGLTPSAQNKVRGGLRRLEEFGLGLMSTKWVKKIHSRPDLYELRITGKPQIRLIFITVKNYFIIINALVKKQQKIPQKEMTTTLKRALEYL